MGAVLSMARDEAASAVLAFVGDPITLKTVGRIAADLDWPKGSVRLGGVNEAIELLRSGSAPAVLLVDVGDAADPLAAMDALADVCEAHTRVVAIGEANDIELYRRLISLGVSDYLVKPVSPEALVLALRHAEQGVASKPAPISTAAKTFALMGVRGGVGATSLAVSLAWALAHEHMQRTVLLDLDLQFGAAPLSLDLEPGRGLREMLSNPERIDGLLIGSAMVSESERLRFLGAEEPVEDDIQVGAAGVRALLASLTTTSEAVVVDTPRQGGAAVRETLARADVVGLVTDLSLPAMRDTQRLLGHLKSLRPEGPVRLIANRVGGVPGELPRAEFERGVGAILDLVVPFDLKTANAAAGSARSLLQAADGAAAVGVELRRMAELFTGAQAAPAAPERLSWVQRILGR